MMTEKKDFDAEKIVCLGLFVLFFLINLLTIHDGHNWGGDFSQYILHAQNLLAGRDYNFGIMLDNKVVCPVGFPLMIAPLIHFFGVNFPVLKLLNLIFWHAAVVCFYFLFRRSVGEGMALLSALVLVSSFDFFKYKQNVLADIPFVFFVAAALSVFAALDDRGDGRRGALFALFAAMCSMAFLVRPVGSLLFVCAIIYFIFIRKRLNYAIIMLLMLVALGAGQIVMTDHGPGLYRAQLFQMVLNHPLEFGKTLVKNFSAPFVYLTKFYIPDEILYVDVASHMLQKVVAVASPLILGIMVFAMVSGIREKTISLQGLFLIFYLVALVLWAGTFSVPSGFMRFVIPVAGLVLLYLARGLQWVGRSRYFSNVPILRLGLLFLVFINALHIVVFLDFNDDVFAKASTRQMISWVKEHIGKDEHYMSWHYRPLALMTGRVGTVPWDGSSGEQTVLSDRMNEFRISYLILDKQKDQQLVLDSIAHPQIVTPVWENEEFIIFKVSLSG